MRDFVRGVAAWSLVMALIMSVAMTAEARPDSASSGAVPAMVRRALPAVVNITTRQIEINQFNQPVASRGLGSGFIVDRESHRWQSGTCDVVVEGNCLEP